MASVKLKHTSGNGTILHSPAANPSSDVTLKLPSTTGSAGQVLKVASANHSSTNAELEFGADASGKILQVKQTVKTDTFSSTTTGSDVDITGLSVSITPTAASSDVLVSYDTNVSMSNAGYSGNIHLKRGSTKIYQGDAEGSRTRSSQFVITRNDTIGHLVQEMVHGLFLDSPTYTLGDTLTYKISFNAINSHFTVNKTMYDSNASGVARYPSSITVMEVSA